ncbi:NUDIX domain-containing protein [Ureibacillus chungkukjangi]|uniref:8-oxo-dGTP diphosphatase n=1 Tax=Ureibacillus chungkukjangi TaxID=1202712 RepID=A0A318TPS1_9BACL|nr:NUDIX hydrolase [Ureibacillus chungkukjangi]PYF06816.1 8-oxo-dGTP diphosphatase [Ureibacillus chungkukjangi]
MKRIDVVSALIYDVQGNILLVKNRKGDSFYWGLPGGAVESGETLEEAVVREVSEETGFTIEVAGLSSLREVFFDKKNHHALIVTFFAKIIGGEININDPDGEIEEVKWVDIETARELMAHLFDMLRINPETHKIPAFYEFEGTQ